VELEQARQFIREHHRAVVAVRRPDGGAQMSVVVVGLDDDGRATISSRETAFKVRRLRQEPRLSICVLSDNFFGQWIQVDGTAEVVPLPEAMELLVEYYRSVSGEHPDWDDYRRAMERDRRVLIRVTLERAGPDREG
jgi:PPOX class probable F420-dependent enzyme